MLYSTKKKNTLTGKCVSNGKLNVAARPNITEANSINTAQHALVIWKGMSGGFFCVFSEYE